MFENIKRGIKWSPKKSPFIQLLRQQIRGVQNYGEHADIILECCLGRELCFAEEESCYLTPEVVLKTSFLFCGFICGLFPTVLAMFYKHKNN